MEDARGIAQSLSGLLPLLGIDPRCVTAAPFRRFPIHLGSCRSVDVSLLYDSYFITAVQLYVPSSL